MQSFGLTLLLQGDPEKIRHYNEPQHRPQG
jgi:hypothetical protein